MSIIFADGFDTYDVDELLPLRPGWIAQNLETTAFITTTGGRFNGGFMTMGASSGLDDQLYCSPKDLSTQPTVVIAGAFKKSTWSGTTVMMGYNGTVQQWHLLQNAGNFQLQNGNGQVLATSSIAAPVDQWFWFELKITHNATTGAAVLRIDEAEGFNITGADTVSNASPGNAITQIRFDETGQGTGSFMLDDFIVIIDDATGLSDLPGDTRISTLRPDGAGSQSNWTATGAASNWQAVDDGATKDDDTTYVESDTNGQQDLYTFGNLPIIPAAIHAVQVGAWCKKDNAGTRNIDFLARENVTTGNNGPAFQGQPPAGFYGIRTQIFDQNPDTAAAWSGAEVDAAEFGYQPDA